MSAASHLTQAQYKQVRESVALKLSGEDGRWDISADDIQRAERLIDGGFIDVPSVLVDDGPPPILSDNGQIKPGQRA